LKVNAAGVMPIIFAQALMFVPGLLTKFDESNTFLQVSRMF
jgi:preprotein translocase subunit SecY